MLTCIRKCAHFATTRPPPFSPSLTYSFSPLLFRSGGLFPSCFTRPINYYPQRYSKTNVFSLSIYPSTVVCIILIQRRKKLTIVTSQYGLSILESYSRESEVKESKFDQPPKQNPSYATANFVSSFYLIQRAHFPVLHSSIFFYPSFNQSHLKASYRSPGGGGGGGGGGGHRRRRSSYVGRASGRNRW